MTTSLIRRRAAAATVAVAGGLLAGALAQAGIGQPSSTEVIRACRHPSSFVRIVDDPADCRSHEQPVSWNAQGPPGPAGPPGAQGPPGPAGAGITSLDDLQGIACGSGAGTLQVGYGDGGGVTLTCVGGGGGGGGEGTADVTVNELVAGVTGAAANEFVELVNTGDGVADLSGWKLVYRSASGTGDVVLATVPDGTLLTPGSHYLFGGAAYAGGPPADQSFSTSIAATGGGVGIRDAGGALVDSLGWGTASNALVEGAAAPAPPTTEAPGTSLARSPDGADTNDNAADFTLDSSPTPRAANG